MCLQLTDLLMTYSLLSPFQSGFRPGYSTSDVVLYFSDLWRKAIDNGLVTGVVFLDLSIRHLAVEITPFYSPSYHSMVFADHLLLG